MIDAYSPIICASHTNIKRNDTEQKEYRCNQTERRRSFNSTLEDAVTINALNPLQKQMSQLLNVNSLNNGKGWQPPNYDVDLNPSYDGHSFLSPKLFHSKKLLDSNIIDLSLSGNKKKQCRLPRIKKKGPREIGRMKGFKSPKFKNNNNNNNNNNTNNGKSSRIQRNKKKTKKNNHSRWASNGLCIKPMNLKRKYSTHSLRSCNSSTSTQKFDDDGDAGSIIINKKKHTLLNIDDGEDDEDEDAGMIFVNDYVMQIIIIKLKKRRRQKGNTVGYLHQYQTLENQEQIQHHRNIVGMHQN